MARSRKPRSAAQIAASKRNLEKARAARAKKAGTATGADSPFSTSTMTRFLRAGANTKDVQAFKALSPSSQKKVASSLGVKDLKAFKGKKVKTKLTDSQIAKKYQIPRSRVRNGMVMNEFGMPMN